MYPGVEWASTTSMLRAQRRTTSREAASKRDPGSAEGDSSDPAGVAAGSVQRGRSSGQRCALGRFQPGRLAARWIPRRMVEARQRLQYLIDRDGALDAGYGA